MGRVIEDKEYCAEDYEKFNKQIHDQLDTLKEIIRQPDFGQGITQIGAELELYLMDSSSNVSPVNLQLLKLLEDPQFVSEINQFVFNGVVLRKTKLGSIIT